MAAAAPAAAAPAAAAPAAAAPAAAEEGQVIGVHSLDSWIDLFQKGKDAKQLMVVDFTASWCPPCRMIAPIFVEMAKKLPNVMFLKVDVDEMKEIAEQWQVEAMPTFLFFKEGNQVDKFVGAQKDALQAVVTKHAV